MADRPTGCTQLSKQQRELLTVLAGSKTGIALPPTFDIDAWTSLEAAGLVTLRSTVRASITAAGRELVEAALTKKAAGGG